MTTAAPLKYEVHYSGEILFLEPVPVKIVNEQKSFLPAAHLHPILSVGDSKHSEFMENICV